MRYTIAMRSLTYSRRGQTLVEALVALSLLTMGFIGIATLLTKSFQLDRTAADETQGTYLAAEGIEVAKNIIDYDVYYGLPKNNYWECSFQLSEGQSKDYALAYDTTPPANCAAMSPMGSATGDDKLYFDASTSLYSYDNIYTPTDFTRDVDISVPSSSPNELDVQSVVTWNNGNLSNTITLEDHFYSWHP